MLICHRVFSYSVISKKLLNICKILVLKSRLLTFCIYDYCLDYLLNIFRYFFNSGYENFFVNAIFCQFLKEHSKFLIFC